MKQKKVTLKNQQINEYLFDQIFNNFSKYIEKKEGKPFYSISTCITFDKEEGYKHKIYEKARDILEISNWEEKLVGTGEILKKIVSAIEVKVDHYENRGLHNNLVFTSHHNYSEKNKIHKKIIGAAKEKDYELEEYIYKLFLTDGNDKEVFKYLVNRIGKKYGLIAYIFFLKNKRKYLPISPSNFEKIFRKMDVDIKLSHQCSWQNYQTFLKLVNKSSQLLEERLSEEVDLLDAHSYLWMIKDPDIERDEMEKKITCEEAVLLPLSDKKGEKGSPAGNNKTKISPGDRKNINKKKGELGKEGEGAVLDYLKQNKQGEIFYVVAEDEGAGYDIEVVKKDEKELIEVKTTSRVNILEFFISRNEYYQGLEYGNIYYLYLVTDIKKTPRIKYIQNPFATELSVLGDVFKTRRDKNINAIPQSVKVRINVK